MNISDLLSKIHNFEELKYSGEYDTMTDTSTEYDEPKSTGRYRFDIEGNRGYTYTWELETSGEEPYLYLGLRPSLAELRLLQNITGEKTEEKAKEVLIKAILDNLDKLLGDNLEEDNVEDMDDERLRKLAKKQISTGKLNSNILRYVAPTSLINDLISSHVITKDDFLNVGGYRQIKGSGISKVVDALDSVELRELCLRLGIAPRTVESVKVKSFKLLNEAIGEAIDKLDSFVLKEEKQILVDKDKCIEKAESLAVEMGLPTDKWAVETRKKYTTDVYYTYIREVKADNKLYLKYISSALQGNLAPWFANEIKTDTNAPMKWRTQVNDTVEELFKSVYELGD